MFEFEEKHLRAVEYLQLLAVWPSELLHGDLFVSECPSQVFAMFFYGGISILNIQVAAIVIHSVINFFLVRDLLPLFFFPYHPTCEVRVRMLRYALWQSGITRA